MTAGRATHPGTGLGMGLPYEKVMIEEVVIEEGYAVVRNEHGKPRSVPIHGRARGMTPATGETWLISRDLGFWTFALCILPKPPTITGSTDGLPALESLLEQLELAGLIVNETTSTRIRATHPHTHGGVTAGGATTGTDAL